MSAKEVGEGLVAMCKAAKFDEASETYYDDQIVSVEAFGDDRETRGMDSVRKKMEWWNSKFTVNSAVVDGPWVNEPFFIAQYEIDVTDKETGENQVMKEYAVYEVRGGKVVSERFF